MPYRTIADLPYRAATPEKPDVGRCRLDLYLPPGSGFPTLLFFHGGGLVEGTRAWIAGLGAALASQGIAVAAADYHFSPGVRFPAYVDDAAAAITWVLGHIAEYGGDARQVVVGGHSAGAYLAALVGLDGSHLARHGHSPAELAGLLPLSGQLIVHFTVRAERGIPATTLLIDAAAPLAHVHAGAPPCLFMAADGDLPPRPEENRYIAASLKALGVDAAYIEIAGRDHSGIIDRASDDGDPAQAAMVAFIRRVAAARASA
jgi:acetyl esterase/lipase